MKKLPKVLPGKYTCQICGQKADGYKYCQKCRTSFQKPYRGRRYPERDRQILESYLKSPNCNRVAKEFGFSREFIRRIVKRYGLNPQQGKAQREEERKKRNLEIYRMFQERGDQGELSRIFELSKKYIRQIILEIHRSLPEEERGTTFQKHQCFKCGKIEIYYPARFCPICRKIAQKERSLR